MGERDRGRAVPEVHGGDPVTTSGRTSSGRILELLKMVDHLYRRSSCRRLRRGGHDPEPRSTPPTRRAVEHTGQPTVILAKTIKGYGLGEAGEGRNIDPPAARRSTKSRDAGLPDIVSTFPISDEELKNAKAPFYRPADDSEESEVPARPPEGRREGSCRIAYGAGASRCKAPPHRPSSRTSLKGIGRTAKWRRRWPSTACSRQLRSERRGRSAT